MTAKTGLLAWVAGLALCGTLTAAPQVNGPGRRLVASQLHQVDIATHDDKGFTLQSTDVVPGTGMWAVCMAREVAFEMYTVPLGTVTIGE